MNRMGMSTSSTLPVVEHGITVARPMPNGMSGLGRLFCQPLGVDVLQAHHPQLSSLERIVCPAVLSHLMKTHLKDTKPADGSLLQFRMDKINQLIQGSFFVPILS